MKLCSRKLDTLSVCLVPQEETRTSTLTLQMPIGGYSVAEGIQRTCGLAGKKTHIGEMDDPTSFYSPDRFDAQLI